MVFGNNTASDISKFWSNYLLRASIIAKYDVQVMLLFVYIEAEKFLVMQKRPFFLRLKKTNTGVNVHNNLFTSMEEMIDSVLWNQYKANNMKQFNEGDL